MLSTVQTINSLALVLLCTRPGRKIFCCPCGDIDGCCQKAFVTISFDHIRDAELAERFVPFLGACVLKICLRGLCDCRMNASSQGLDLSVFLSAERSFVVNAADDKQCSDK